MTQFWDTQIHRADELAAEPGGARDLLVFYSQLLRAQKQVYQQLRSRHDWLPTADLPKDFAAIQEAISGVFETVALHGPSELATQAQGLLNADAGNVAEKLCAHWQKPTDIDFFPKAILQPYAHWLRERGARPFGRQLPGDERTCPFCGGRPQVSFLQSKESTAESGNRDLICSTCLHSWEFRRIVCAYCGEERPAQLSYFHSARFDHIRIEACDTCKRYLKGIDLTRVGLAAPLVDEIYAVPLDLWAVEHGYTKIELNLVGV